MRRNCKAKMHFLFHPANIITFIMLFATPAYANQVFVNRTRSSTIQQIAEFYLKHSRHLVVRSCRMGKQYNAKGLSYFRENTPEFYTTMAKKLDFPYDVVKKDIEGKNYAMYSVCPDVY